VFSLSLTVFEMMLDMVMFFGEGKVNICMLFMTMMQVLVLYQIAYIAWVWVVEGRFRPTLASLFMYSSRGLLGYSTQLPVPQVFRSPPLPRRNAFDRAMVWG
jgi:hypothetical protein